MRRDVRSLLLIALGAAVALTAGCAGVPVSGGAPVVDKAPISSPEPAASVPAPVPDVGPAADEPDDGPIVRPLQRQPAPPVPPGSTAVVALLEDAEQQSGSGRLDTAAVSLERALRIEPRNAQVWYRLAQVRMRQGKLDQAEGLATKSMVLAGDDRRLRADNWRLVAHIRQRRGDHEGARAADAKAAALDR